MGTAEQTRPGSETVTPRWQRAFAGLGLTLVTLFVAGPIGAAVLLLWAVILGVAGAQMLESAGLLRADAFVASLVISALIVGTSGLASLAARLPRALRRAPAAAPPVQPSVSNMQWLLRHPWISVGLLLFTADVVLVPLDRSGALDVDAVLIGTILFGAALWLTGSLAYGLIRGWALVLKLIWGGVRSSSFFAGIVVLGSIVITGGANLLWSSAPRGADSVMSTQPAQRLDACTGLDCLRLALGQVAHGGRAVDPAPLAVPAAPTTPPLAPLALPEPPSSFDQCIQELHRSEPGFESARQMAMRVATQRAIPPAEAEDLVHNMMLAVCQGAERIAEVRPYFIRSVQNAVTRQRRFSRKWCPLDPDDPPPGTELCMIDSLSKQAVQEQMETAAWQALCELAADDRRIIELRLWANLSHAEVARRLGVTEAAARKKFSRAQATLKEKFDRRCR